MEIFHTLKSILKKRGYSTGVGDEGGFAPSLKSNGEALEVVLEAITKAGFKPGGHVFIALDPAASEFYDDEEKLYVFKKSGEPSDERADGGIVGRLGEAVPDLLDRRRPGRRRLGRLGADDRRSATRSSSWGTTSSSPTPASSGRHQQGIANSILIKLNQIGTVTETLDAMKMAADRLHRRDVHRSGETEDSTIADLAVGTEAGQIKTGSASRTDRVAKYNQLLRIEQGLGAPRAMAAGPHQAGEVGPSAIGCRLSALGRRQPAPPSRRSLLERP